jgi:hypothetical protein
LIDKDLKDKLDNFDKQQKELEKAQKGLVDDVVDTLKKIIQGAPMIAAIRWHQYTPGFNDGDPCEFTIGDLEVKFDEDVIAEYGDQEKARKAKVEEEDDEQQSDDEFVSSYEVEDFIKSKIDVLNHREIGLLEKQYEAVGALYDALNGMGNELERRFGDNIRIMVTKDGIETEDYDCGY